MNVLGRVFLNSRTDGKTKKRIFFVRCRRNYVLNNMPKNKLWIEQKGMTFAHDFVHSFPLFSSLLKKGKKKR